MQKFPSSNANIDPTRWVTVTKPDGTTEMMRAKDIDFLYEVAEKPSRKYVAAPKPEQTSASGDDWNDWKRWALMGGGGLLAYSIASNMMDNGKKKKSIWDKALDLIVPLGVGGLGAYGAYRLGDYLGLKKAAQAGVAQVTPAGVVVEDGKGPHQITTPDKWDHDLQLRFEKYLDEYKNDHEPEETFRSWIERQHSDVAAYLKATGSAAVGAGATAVAAKGARAQVRDKYDLNNMARDEVDDHMAKARDAHLKGKYEKPGSKQQKLYESQAKYHAAQAVRGEQLNNPWRKFWNGGRKWGGTGVAVAGALGAGYNLWDALYGGAPYEEAVNSMDDAGKAYVPYWGPMINPPEQEYDWQPAQPE